MKPLRDIQITFHCASCHTEQTIAIPWGKPHVLPQGWHARIVGALVAFICSTDCSQ